MSQKKKEKEKKPLESSQIMYSTLLRNFIFPLHWAANATQYTLGRKFLQEVYVTGL